MNATTKQITVRDVMKKEYGMIGGMETIQDALLMMKRLRTSVLVVDKRNKDDEFGLLLVSDIARKVMAKDRSCKRTNVYEVMNKPAVSLDPNMDIRYCARLFARFSLVRALVVEDEKVLGTISPNSLVLDGLFALDED
jgi:predicted transcriptional regulator